MTHVERIVKCLKKDRVYIQTHNFPDADAISCAYGMRVLLAKYGIRATICYRRKQDSYSVNMLVQALRIGLTELCDEHGEDIVLEDDDEIIVVDSQKGNANVADIGGTYVACIDHHPITGAPDYKYYDIRTELGACATIICDYFVEEMVPFHKKTATLLTYGIRTDTDNLCRGVSQMDIEMLAKLYSATDYELIRLLENSMMYQSNLKKYSEALAETTINHNISFTYAGDDGTDLLISQICDFMLSVVEVEVSIVCTTRPDGIKLSIRSISPKIDAGIVSQYALAGIGSGGGHAYMAGAFVPYSEDLTRDELIEEIHDRYMREIHMTGGLTEHDCETDAEGNFLEKH